MSRESILERNRERAKANDRKMGATALGTSALNYSTQQSLERAATEKVERESGVSPSIKSPGTLLKNDLFSTNPTQRFQTSPRESEKQQENQDDYSFKDRANDFLQGTLTSVAGSIGNFIGGALDFADQAGREFLYNTLVIPEEELERRGADTPENLAATELLREIRDRENPLVEGIYDLSDKGLQMGQEQYERAKEGVGPVASTLMDVGRVGIEMGTDALAGALTGGTGLLPMVARSFGGGVSQARANGAENEEALLAGAAQGGIDYLTERMFGIALPFSKVYGGGSLDDIVQNGISSAVSRFAKTEAGQRALGGGLTLGASALTEGAEEFIADWMGWQLPKIIYDGEVATAEETLSNSLYDFLVGSITGGIGGAVTPATYHYRIPESATPTLDNQAADSDIISSPTESATPMEVSRQALESRQAQDTLSNGYTDTYGNRFSPNEDYIRMKQEIPGYQPPEDLPIWDMDEGRGRTSEELARDMLQVQKAANVLGENGSKALTAAYDRNIARNYSPEQVVEGFYRTYNAVMEGKEAPSVDLPEQVKIAAESSAQLDRTRAEQARHFGENSGLVRDQNQKKARLSTQDSRRLDALGKALGVQIRFETAIDDGAGHEANAKYGDGVISLSLDAEDPIFTSVIHEAVHRIRETDPDAYTQLSDLVQTSMTDKTMDFILRSRSQRYGTENRDSLTEELVADAFGRMVREESLDKLVQDNRTVVQKVLDVIRDIITKIQNVLSGKGVTLTANQKAEFRDLESRMGEMERTFREALERQQNREGGQESGKTRFSLKGYTDADENLDPNSVQPVNDITDRGLYGYLVDQFSKNGYSGRPIVVLDNQNEGYIALTGSHRILAAREAGIEVPAVVVENREAYEALYDALRDDDRAQVAEELYEDGLLREIERDLIVREEELNNENYNVPYNRQARFSLKPTDSQGRELSEEQRRYFQGSKITDADDRLLVIYHGTTAYGEITKFRRGRSGWLGPGIYLASRQADAKRYADAMGEGNGQLYELYANATNPLVVTEGNPVPEILRAAYGRDSVYRSRSAKQGNDAQIITTADIKKLQSKGYDGIRWDFGGSTEVSVFSPEQIKRVDNLTPSGSQDVRYSLKAEDSQGRELTQEQQEFFRDSKVVDSQGRLRVMFRGDGEQFTVFDRKRSRYSNMYGRGFYFTDSETHASQYGSARQFYLNITNPVLTDETTITRAQMRKFLKAVAENEDDFSFENYGYGATVDSVLKSVYGKSDFSMLYDVSQTAIGDMVAAVELFNEVNGTNYDGFILDTETVAFRPEQIKNTTNRTPTSDPDIRYSLSNREQLDQYIQEYGAIPRGERPYREVQIPKRTSETQKVSQTVRTILEAQATPNEAIQRIEELVADGTLSYNPYSDRQAMTDAENTIRDKGYATALSDWTRSVRDGEVSKRLTAEGWELYNQAANAGDMKSAMTILTNMVEHQRNAAQALQATRILKKMSPESQLYGVQRSAQNLTRELKDKYGADYPDIRIDEELATRFLEAKTDLERDQAMQDLYRDIGKQMPSRFIDKWNAWRYLAMLGNPRTHIRNITGNAFFTPVIAAKDLTATAIESAVSRVSGGKIGRTKGMVTPKDLDILTAAWNDFANSQDRILGGGKYSDSANANRYIQEGRRIFHNPILERTRTANSQALDLEDAWFSKPHYAYALAQYAKANGITAEQIRSGKGLDAARAYAIREAQKATYRDTNAFSEMVSGWGRYRGDNKIRRLGSTVLEGILPFRKTPANILVRGVEYSPLGLLKGLTYDLVQVKKGNMEVSTAIDNISAGLTGTGLLTLGVYLAAEGLVRGAGGDDDSEREYKELQGHQSYSLELGDQSFTLDWLAPEALPFFVGVNLWEQTQAENEDVTLSAMLQAVQNITDPILEMSCLQSLNDVFDAVGYASSEDLGALPSILSSAATSYLTQGIPTILGQAERTGQDVRMTTYTERNAFLTSDMQYTIGRASSRIPGWDYQQIPYIDAWGRTESSGTVGRRAVDNFLNPAYSSTIIESPMEAELERLYEQTGDTGVLPSRAVRYVTVDGERKDLTAEEYVKYAQNKGQTAYNILTELTAGAAYQAATDDVKAEMVDLVYQYSNDTAKVSVSSYKPDGWVAKAQAAEKMGITESQYISLYVQQKSIESLKDRNGETIPDSKGLQIMELVYSVKGLTDKQRQKLFEDFNVGKNVRHFNQTLVKNRLERMRK